MSTPEAPTPPAGKPPWLLLAGIFVAFWVAYLIVAGPRQVDDIDGPEPGRPGMRLKQLSHPEPSRRPSSGGTPRRDPA